MIGRPATPRLTCHSAGLDDAQPFEVAPIESAVAGEEGLCLAKRVSAHQEVGDDPVAAPSTRLTKGAPQTAGQVHGAAGSGVLIAYSGARMS